MKTRILLTRCPTCHRGRVARRVLAAHQRRHDRPGRRAFDLVSVLSAAATRVYRQALDSSRGGASVTRLCIALAGWLPWVLVATFAAVGGSATALLLFAALGVRP